jgi:hypothetical protein
LKENNNNNQDSNADNENRETQTTENPNIFRIVFSFIITFFTSLIPERARVPN